MKRKSTALVLILLILLSAAGLVYAHWTDTLQIFGTVETGEEKVEITCYKCGKWGWSCWRKRYTTVCCTLSEDKQSVEITWNNIWPCSKMWLVLVMKNTGTIPVDIEDPKITFEDGIEEWFTTHQIFFGPFDGSCPEAPDDDADPPDCWDWCKPPEPPIQLDPGQKLILAWCVHFWPECCRCCMGKTVHITLTLNYHTWNLP
jgi:hypothetical protein